MSGGNGWKRIRAALGRVLALTLTLVLAAGMALPALADNSLGEDSRSEEVSLEEASREEISRDAGKKLVAITFDDGPGPYTARLLDGLKARGAKATFFMLGQNAARYPEIVERVYQEGHQVANHSYDHSDLAGLSWAGVQSQIQRTNGVLDRTCGAGTSYVVRAPYGSFNRTVLQAAGAPFAFWAVDPQDWLYRNSDTVRSRIINSVSDGDIILVHDIHATTIPGALGAIDYLQARGYEFVTLRELFRRRGAALQNGVSYSRCAPNGKDVGPVKAPVITAAPVGDKLRITITAQAGADIYYTTGKTLNQRSTRYTGPFLVSAPYTLRAAAAFNMNGSRSGTVEKTFTMPTAAAPRIEVLTPGAYGSGESSSACEPNSSGELRLSCSTEGADIHYTLTGVTEGSGIYREPIPIGPGTEITAWAEKSGWLDSARAHGSYSSRGNFFRDMSAGQWFYEPIDRAVSAGYISGTGDHKVSPKGTLSRGQLVTMLYTWAKEPVEDSAVSGLPFPDVKAGSYYAKAVAWAYEKGLAGGYKDGTFQPDRPVSRQEMSLIFSKLIEARGVAVEDSAGAAEKFSDRERIAPWALEAVERMTAAGLFTGDDKGCFRPGESSTRGQAATVLMAFADWMERQSTT